MNIPFEKPLPSLLPFVPILKGGDNESTIREALQVLRRDENLNQLETVLAFFATFVLESSVVQDIMRWDMAVLRESPWYQEILREGEARGEVRGIISSIQTILESKFGQDGLELMPQISQINDFEQLQDILRSISLANNIEEIRQILSL